MVQEIEVSKLKIHPKNIRKTYEGIDELAASIKEKGVMQNLTAVPDPEEKGTFFVVIGNRRLTAAKEAGLKTVPCAIFEDMDDKAQVTTMLTENMNRKDLKVYEESAAMQMCLTDFGYSVEDIAKSTGLSQSTVNHRLNIAKLNQKELEKKVNDPEFQITMTDLQSLEKVSDVKTRNKILKEAENSAELANKARQAAREEKKEKNKKALLKMCKKLGIEEANEDAKTDWYGTKYEKIQQVYMEDEVPEKFDIEDGTDLKEVFFYVDYGRFYIVKKKKKVKKELTPEQIAQKEKDKKKREIKAKYKEIVEDIRQFMMEIVDGKVPAVKETEEVMDEMWKFLMVSYVDVEASKVAEMILGREIYSDKISQEDREAALARAKEMPMIHQMLGVCLNGLKGLDFIDFRGGHSKVAEEKFQMMFKCLNRYGYTLPDEESQQVIDGSHPNYEEVKTDD